MLRGTRPVLAAGGFRVAHAHTLASTPDVSLAILGVVLSIGAGYAGTHGEAKLAIWASVALATLVLAVKWPELLLVVWFAAILSNGRWLTYHKVGPLYVTEPLLVLLVLGLAIRRLVNERSPSDWFARRPTLRFLLLLSAIVWVPAAVGLLIRTNTYDAVTGRNFALIVYVIFALLIASVTDLSRSYRAWFVGILLGSGIALGLVITGHAGQTSFTSTGAVRVAAYTFLFAFGIAPLVLIAAAREGLIRPMYAAAATTPFLVGLVFVNHRSAWLAFVVSSAIVFGKRLTPPILVGLLAVVAVLAFVLTHQVQRESIIGQEIARAKTIASTNDPNARFRLDFWRVAMERSIQSPIIGAGFDPFPPEIVPPETLSDPFPSPHNSFVSIGYRIGFIPLLLLLVLLAHLVIRGFRASMDRPDPRDRATCTALAAIVVYAGISSSFNVFLEAPYAGPLFWTAVGLLAYAVYSRPFESAQSRPAELQHI
jgi:O-antigen ligase/polysaccharide polymerase Wzy-like membrane protein